MDPHLVGCLFAALASALFATKGVITKWAYAEGTDPTALLAVRFLSSLPVFLLVAWWQGRKGTSLTRRDLASLAVCGLIGYHLGAFLDLQGLRFIGAGLERIVLYLYPTLTVLLVAALGRGRPTPATLAAIALTWAGVALSCLHQPLAGADVPLGVALVAGSACTTAIYLVAAEPLTRRLGGVRSAAWMMIAAAGGVLLHALVSLSPAAWQAQPVATWQAGLVLGLGATVAPVLLTGAALRRIGSGAVAVVGTVGPCVTMLLAWAVLGEVPTWLGWAGFVLTVVGGALIAVAGRRR